MNVYYIVGSIVIVVLVVLLIYLLSRRKTKEPSTYILVVSFKNGVDYDLCNDERVVKLGEFKRNGNEFIVQTRLNEVRLKKEIGKLLEIDLANIYVVIKRW